MQQSRPARPFWLILATLPLLAFLGLAPSAAAPARQPIRLLYATFDPLVDGEPAVPIPLRAQPGSPYALLQLPGPIRAEWQAGLVAAGVFFYGYVPDHAYLVRLPAGGHDRVAAHPAVRWLGPFHPAYKLSPTLRPGRLLLLLFPDADVAGVAQAAVAAGATIQEQYPAAHLLVVEAPAAAVPALAAIEGVQWLQNDSPIQELNDDARWLSQGNLFQTTPLYDHGLTGDGQVGAIADSGLAAYDFGGGPVPSCYFLDDGAGGAGGAPLPPGDSHRKVISYTIPISAGGDLVDGSGHGSHVVGSFAGDQAPWNTLSPADGQSYQARVFFQDIGQGDPVGTINPPPDYRILFGEAYDPNEDGLYQPATEPRTHSNSWGATDPIYSAESAQTDDFMWTHPDFLILYAAGNQGPAPGTIGYPATAKNIVTVGGTENGLASPNSMGYFSSHGPAPIGRLKPTISAPGDRVTSALKGDPCGTAERAGTSMATPTVHGLALLVRQYVWQGYYPTGVANPADQRHPSAALLKALLINSGRPMDGAHTDNATGGAWPSHGQGWGRVTAGDALYFQGDHRALWLYDEYALDGSAGFDAVGQARTFTVTVGAGQPFNPEPLEITLVWTDYMAVPIAGGALVNNLDLAVVGPGPATYLGNDASTSDFNGLPDLPATMPDAVNPWEVVYLASPASGVYTITVTAASLGSLPLDPAARKQGFALVVTGDLMNSRGRAEIEYPVYEVNPAAVARLRISDLDLNTNPAAIETTTATITSTTTPAGLPVTLTETTANSGIFAGQITFTTETPAAGELSVSPGDTVRLLYQDANAVRRPSSAVYRPSSVVPTADTALIGLPPLNFANPPELADPGATDADGDYTLSWTLAEDTTGLDGYIVQETTAFARSLLDDAEGAIGDNWTTGQPTAPWTSSMLFQHSGASSFWSGRGDTGIFIDTSLALNHDVTLPLTVTTASLTFYSRYFNDFNDYGRVEMSAGGGPWTPLRRLYADPRLVPLGGRLQFHQLDLSGAIGQPIRVRFRYDNGILSVAPDSPGWWLDDVTISGGAWQTIGATPAGTTSLNVTGRPAGRYYYRIQAIYGDGSVTGWSNAADMQVLDPTVLGLRRATASQSRPARPWLAALALLGLASLAILVLQRALRRTPV
ncbi:MAG: S8 family serine peptidase [Chloroflexi bacterium]|nr:S8 family serine peptidase [Chloroflexota bacterium]MCI0579082.1 S8 family serine peptidase [Chloroflexota bacterium]MCI0644063.1 S8 family serine peptidase [Chloroflexota bacterium]MCI0727879.1 S8 family serine peptidase [Chloroflexota bacterium]